MTMPAEKPPPPSASRLPFKYQKDLLAPLIDSPELSTFFQHFHHWRDATRDDDGFLNQSISCFMRGQVIDGLIRLGCAFPSLLQFKKDLTGEPGEEDCCFVKDCWLFCGLRFHQEGPPPTNTLTEVPTNLLVITDYPKKELARMDCASVAGRRTLIQFLHQWGTAAHEEIKADYEERQRTYQFIARTTSVTGMRGTPELSFFYKHYEDWTQANQSDEPLSKAVKFFMMGSPLEGMVEFGKVFENLIPFSIIKKRGRTVFCRTSNPRFGSLEFYSSSPARTDRNCEVVLFNNLRIVDRDQNYKVVAKMDCALPDGRKKLIQFLYDWGRKHDSSWLAQRNKLARRIAAKKCDLGDRLMNLSIKDTKTGKPSADTARKAHRQELKLARPSSKVLLPSGSNANKGSTPCVEVTMEDEA